MNRAGLTERAAGGDGEVSGYVSFRPRARLLKIIGSELISDEVVALIELVKNAHDADASQVTVRFISGTDGATEIHIIDDGLGMDRSGLLGGWMEPAGSTKRGENRRHTPSGRRMLGEKGVGRFAADKLGRQLELFSRHAGSTGEVHAVFDWDAFESDTDMLEDVKSHWEIRPATVVPSHGTHLRITGLRTGWTERMFRRLSSRLARLRSPIAVPSPFDIRLESDTFPEYAQGLATSYLERAPYVIDARFDGRRTFATLFNGQKESAQWAGTSDLTCGPVRVQLFAFDLETESLARMGPRPEVRAWLREWSGVSLFRDGYRVWPYGEPHDDWLRLDRRRVNNPVVCLSNNQVVGFVEISQERNPDLRDQTNREGLIQNEALEDLRRAVHFVFQLLESHRQTIRHPSRLLKARGREISQPTDDASGLAHLDALVDQAPRQLKGMFREALGRLRDEIRQREEYQRALVRGFSELAAAGHETADLLDEVGRIRDSLMQVTQAFQQGSPLVAFRETVPAIDEAVRALDRRVALGAVMGRARTSRGGSTVDIGAELSSWAELVQPSLRARNISLKLSGATRQLLRADVAPRTLHQVLGILVANALDWIPARRSSAGINVAVSCSDQDVSFVFSDTGPGIAAEHADRVFEPFFSLKEAGRGMGLTLARELLRGSGGDIRVLIDGRRRGANILVRVPRKRSRSTPVQEHA